MISLEKENLKPLLTPLLTLLLIGLNLVLGFFAWWGLHELSVALAAVLVGALSEITTTQQRAILEMVYNLSMICGGLVWLAMAITIVEYTLRHYATRKAWRLMTWILGIEIAVILLRQIVL